MNVVFVGGGSFRTLPIVRGVLQNPKVIAGGEIRLVDFNLPRVETVAKLIMRTPEFAKAGCKVTWTDKLETALPGANVVSISFPVGSHKVNALSEQACARHGLFGSDQLSVSGTFRAVTGGTIVFDIARQMEKHCPKAWLFDYANPVAVYSGLVNNHTKIRTLGIRGDFTNHRWDLGRLIFGRDEYPLNQNEPETRKLWKELLDIHRDEMPAVFQKAKDFC
jgi:6-phospho-beta-glucosidase